MIQVTYLSRATEPCGDAQLLALLQQCLERNPSRGITGLLFYGNATFLQVLEGEAEVVDPLVERIGRDARHADVRILSRKALASREYAQWSMGFERVTDEGLRTMQGVQDFTAADFTPAGLAGRGDVVDSLMDRFRTPHWDPLVRELDAKDRLVAHLQGELARERGRAGLAMLVAGGLADAARQGTLGADHLRLSEAALRTLRGE